MEHLAMTRLHASRPVFGALGLIATVALAACTAGGASPGSAGPSSSAIGSAGVEPSISASPLATAEPSAKPSEPTESLPPFVCTPSASVASTTDRAQITDVRVGTHDGYDRVVFEFAAGIPDAVIEGVLPPFYADPSGLELPVSGTAFLRITMHGASRMSPEGSVTYGGSTTFEPGFNRLVELIEGGDFEAVSTWYLGLEGAGCYRVLTLADPSRLVIDVQH
jgi:hypothetical protein